MEARTLCFPPRRTLRDRKLYRAACKVKYEGLNNQYIILKMQNIFCSYNPSNQSCGGVGGGAGVVIQGLLYLSPT
jgi:hypothetical protein